MQLSHRELTIFVADGAFRLPKNMGGIALRNCMEFLMELWDALSSLGSLLVSTLSSKCASAEMKTVQAKK